MHKSALTKRRMRMFQQLIIRQLSPPVMRISVRTGLPDSMCKFQEPRE